MPVEFLQLFTLTLGGTTVAIAAVAWLARSITTHWLSKDIETYKTQLKSQSDAALEQLRSDLQIAAARRNLEFSRIHEKRLEIISEVAGRLDAFHQAVSSYVSVIEWHGCPSKEERRKLAVGAFTEFNEYFRPRRLFLPENTVNRIEAFRWGLYKISVDFMCYVEQGGTSSEDPKSGLDAWTRASDYTRTEAPILLKELENDFRKVLGVDNQAA